jgi:glycosyltransferase involved in cell wall biosynthesis
MSRRTVMWILNHYASTPDRGAGTRHYDLSRQLATQGYDVTIFASGFSHFSGTEERLRPFQLFRVESIKGIRFVWLRTIPYHGNSWRRVANMVSYALLVSIVQARFSRPDVVIGSSVHPLAAAAGYAIARVRRRPFIFEVRDLWPQTLIDMGVIREHSRVARMMRWLEAFLVRRASAVVTLLPGMETYLAERGLPAGRLEYIPNGVDLGATSPNSKLIPAAIEAQIKRWRKEGRFICAYVGSHGRANRLEVLVDAMHIPRDGRRLALLLIGDGPEKARLAERSKASTTVRFFDSIPKPMAGAVLDQVDAAIFHLTDTPVFRYGISSNKLFDYLAHGRPVLFACRTTYDPVALASAGVSVPPDDPTAMAAGLRDLAARSDEELRAIGERGRRFIAENHAIDRLAAQLGRLVDDVRGHGSA